MSDVETDLHAGAAGADASARTRLATLYERHIRGTEALAFLLTRDAATAEDLAQEAFVRVATRLHHLRNPDAFAGYLRRTVVNLCRAHFRRLRVERDYLRRVRTRDDVEPAPEPAGDVAAALAQLPYRQRAAVVLRYYEDLSEEQVGDILRCSARAVNALVSRAMATLRTTIEGANR